MKHTVCAFGDSIVKGVVFDSIRGRYSLLKESFANLFVKNTGIRVNNYAKFGCTITKGRQIISRHQEDLSNHSVTVLEFGGNDCDFEWAKIAQNPEADYIPNTPIDKFEAEYSTVIDTIRESGSRPLLISLPPLDPKKYFAWISKGLNAENILKWLGDVDHIYRWHEMYNLVVLRLSAKKDVPLVDIRQAFLQKRRYQDLFCEDGIHPNKEGHRLISDVINGFVAEYA